MQMSIYDTLINSNDTMNKRIYGVLIGVVTNNQDPEKLGRVKVKIPVRECQSETYWARVATLMAGNSRGSFFLPEVNDEVLVAFCEGDIRQPYVIGTLWNAQDKPPEENADGKNNIRKIKSRSGHEIILNDEKSKEKVTVKSSKGHTILLDDEAGGKINIKDKSGKNSVTIDCASNTITLSSDAKIEIKAKSCKVEIDGMSSSVNVESSGQLKLKGASVNIESSGMMNIKSSGMLAIKGSMVKIN